MHLHPVGTININLLHLVLHASQGTLGNLSHFCLRGILAKVSLGISFTPREHITGSEEAGS
jgi:hypothetical protein